MNSSKSSVIFLSLIAILILTQVILSTLIIKRINDLDQAVLELKQQYQIVSPTGRDQPQIPKYVEGVSVDDDPWKGTEDALITIVEFSDFECPFCAQAVPMIEEILTEYEGQVLFVYRDFPLEYIHPHALKAAEATQCARDQGQYWGMHDLEFANQANLDVDSLKAYAAELELDTQRFNDCLDNGSFVEEIRHDISDAQAYQVNSTPTFFVNGHRVVGAQSDALRSIIEEIIQEENE